MVAFFLVPVLLLTGVQVLYSTGVLHLVAASLFVMVMAFAEG